MAPDVEELIKRVNTLTLDKNRLRQKLIQLTNEQNGKGLIVMLNQHSSQQQSSQDSRSTISNSNTDSQSPTNITHTQILSQPNGRMSAVAPYVSLSGRPNIIAGVECTTSSEDDVLYMNKLLKERLEEFEEKWIYLQSKCSALQSELNALQIHYARVNKEKLDLEGKYQKKCEDCDDIKSELKTVVLNYETQLSEMSEHLSSINHANQF